MQARGQIRGSSIVGFAKGHMHAVGGQAPADGVTAKTDGELVSGDSFEVDYGASLQEQQVCRGMRCIDQCEVADLDELATVDSRSQSKSKRGTLGMDQCGQLTRDRRMSFEVAEIPAQSEVGDLSITIGG